MMISMYYSWDFIIWARDILAIALNIEYAEDVFVERVYCDDAG
jgi:hypothetical protein